MLKMEETKGSEARLHYDSDTTALSEASPPCCPTPGSLPHNHNVPAAVDTAGKHGCILRNLLSRPIGDSRDCNPNKDDCGSAAASEHRPRSHSMGAAWWTTIPEVMAADSSDSLNCSDENQPSLFSSECLRVDRLIEVARRQLMTLRTSEDLYAGTGGRISASQPGTPLRMDLEKNWQPRKYSEGSRLKACLQGLRTGFRTPVDQDDAGLQPLDFSCRRRRKLDGICGLPYARPTTGYPTSNTSTDEGLGDDVGSERSILKSILTGRARSHTISACGRSGAIDQSQHSTLQSINQSQHPARQPVALAKKNFHPVTAKVGDCVNQVIAFIRSVPEIATLSGAHQRSVIAASLHRLLLLFMAESNIHFVVAPILQNTDQDRTSESREDRGAAVSDTGGTWLPGMEVPTLQFAESVQSLVSRCQTLGISAEEYRLMKLIALFQAAGGIGSLEVGALADQACAVARCELQQVVEQSCRATSERSHHRYTSLLLTIHTLSGVHCGMLDALFCHTDVTHVA